MPASTLTVDRIVQHMLGDKVAAIVEERTHEHSGTIPAGTPTLRFENVTVRGEIEDVTLEVPAGALVGVAGIAGSGYRAVLSVAAGATRADSARVVLPSGEPLKTGLRGAIGQGVGLVSGDRRRFGVMLDKPIWDNIAQVRAVALRRGRPVHPAPLELRPRAARAGHAAGVSRRRARRPRGRAAVGRQPAEGSSPSGWRPLRRSCCSTTRPVASTSGAKAEILQPALRELSGPGGGADVASSDSA